MRFAKAYKSSPPSQRGAALVVSLLLLLVMTIVGVSSMQATSLEEKMTGNMRDQALAFQAAEAALAAGEARLGPRSLVTDANLPTFSTSGTSGFYDSRHIDALHPAPNWKTIWNDPHKEVNVYSGVTLAKVHSNPAFIIEQLSATCGSSGSSGGASLVRRGPVNTGESSGTVNSCYRITARGTGGSDNAEVILQSIYRR